MSQLLIVQGEKPDQVRNVFRQGLEAFESLYHLRPLDRIDSHSEAIALFPSRRPVLQGIVRLPASDDWICGAGCWFFQGVTGKDGLWQLARHPQRSAGSPEG
jgi:hypothetical protein